MSGVLLVIITAPMPAFPTGKPEAEISKVTEEIHKKEIKSFEVM